MDKEKEKPFEWTRNHLGQHPSLNLGFNCASCESIHSDKNEPWCKQCKNGSHYTRAKF
jgi:hypothetical protein